MRKKFLIIGIVLLFLVIGVIIYFQLRNASQKLDYNGVTFQIPDDYTYQMLEEEPYIYTDTYYMKLIIREESYDSVVSDPNTLTNLAISKGGTITSDLVQIEKNGRQYAYFRADIGESHCFVINTPGLDDNQRFAGQFSVNDNITDEELISVFESIIQTAKPDK